jgi:F-type H+-transporting ATPase subunit gamma
MGAQLRVYRRRIRAIQGIRKTTKAMELVATSRIAKAQQAVEAAQPYANEITRVLSALASNSNTDHPLLVERPEPKRAAVLVVTSDRGLAGAYSSNALRTAGELMALLREERKDPVLYVIGRKGVSYYRFRRTLIDAFIAGADDTAEGPGGDDILGVDEIHIVYTEFRSMLTQVPVATRIAPLVVEESTEAPPEGYLPAYDFEPEPEELLNALLPKYINTRIYAALLDSAASESASRRRAMKAATDNAEELIKGLTRESNQVRQGEITQEISEIVGGADALAAATGSE